MSLKLTLGALAVLATAACTAACNSATISPPVGPDGSGGGKVIATENPGDGDEPGDWGIVGDPSYHRVVSRVTGMTNHRGLQRDVRRRGLALLNVMWEDTGRDVGSSVGPNISDLTLQVRYKQPGQQGETSALLPVIRFPNFTDRTGDIPADKFFVRVGNHRDNNELVSLPLTELLSNIKAYSSRPWAIQGDGNLLSKRDTHFLVSSQAVFLPIPKEGKAEFNPVVFNYQSAPGSPAVLSILVTRQGTSMTVIENRPEDGTIHGAGQELYFNNEGQRAAFTAERLSTVKGRIAQQGGPITVDDKSALRKGADVLFLIQVPLKHDNRGRGFGPMVMESAEDDSMMPAPPSMAPGGAKKEKSDVEQAVLGHGRNRGPFTEGNDLKLERDHRFPIRVTVQFYRATSNGVVEPEDLDAIAKSIGNVYEHADFVGSLVVPQGDAARPTAWNTRHNPWLSW